MATVNDIYAFLNDLAPVRYQMDFDNAGFLVGDGSAAVEHVLLALDITNEVIAEAAALHAQLIVSHHPLIFTPLRHATTDDLTGRKVLALARNGIAAVCMHTNLDVAAGGVNDELAAALRLEDPGPFLEDGLGRIGHLAEPVPLADFAARTAAALNCNGLRYADAGKPVYRVAVGGGACGEYADAAAAAGCDTFVTADLNYHAFLDAAGKGINLIDAGHFPTEDPVCRVLIAYLQEQFPALSVEKSASHREAIQYYVKGESDYVRTF